MKQNNQKEKHKDKCKQSQEIWVLYLQDTKFQYNYDIYFKKREENVSFNQSTGIYKNVT